MVFCGLVCCRLCCGERVRVGNEGVVCGFGSLGGFFCIFFVFARLRCGGLGGVELGFRIGLCDLGVARLGGCALEGHFCIGLCRSCCRQVRLCRVEGLLRGAHACEYVVSRLHCVIVSLLCRSDVSYGLLACMLFCLQRCSSVVGLLLSSRLRFGCLCFCLLGSVRLLLCFVECRIRVVYRLLFACDIDALERVVRLVESALR